MRATFMYRAGDVRVENVPDARLIEPTDALISVTAACICGSDLWPYKELEQVEAGRPMGHEAIGRVEATQSGSVPSKSSFWVTIPIGLHWRRTLAPRMLSVSGARKQSRGCANLREELAYIPFLNAWALNNRCSRLSASLAQVLQLVVSAFLITRPFPPRSRRFTTTSVSAVVPRRCAPTSPSCCPTSWKEGSARAACSIVL